MAIATTTPPKVMYTPSKLAWCCREVSLTGLLGILLSLHMKRKGLLAEVNKLKKLKQFPTIDKSKITKLIIIIIII